MVDGVGVAGWAAGNPLTGSGSPYFDPKSWPPTGGVATTLDACLGVPGLPQSATGQATLITGHNAAEFLGRHQSGFASGRLRHLLRPHSLFAQVLAMGLTAAHANVAPQTITPRAIRLASAGAIAALEAGLLPRSVDMVETGQALHHEFTNNLLRSRGIHAPVLTPGEAGSRLATLASTHHFTLFEYFATDAAGHAQDAGAVRRCTDDLTGFLDSLRATAPADLTVVLTSDHGNVEDLSTSHHTYNRVPLLAWGAGAHCFAELESLMDVAASVLGVVGRKSLKDNGSQRHKALRSLARLDPGQTR
jgi:hypothetical protein